MKTKNILHFSIVMF